MRVFLLSPRVANVPALTLGAIVMFFGQKYLAFQSSSKPTVRELVLFGLVQLGGLALTGALFDLAVHTLPFAFEHYVLTRLVVTNLVWLGYSFPLWHYVFPQKTPSA